uniref:Zinc transporter ZIP13 n=1 Tax=Syphacia muris TaxID=451379 RepID=A0A0N5ARD2_9BILA
MQKKQLYGQLYSLSTRGLRDSTGVQLCLVLVLSLSRMGYKEIAEPAAQPLFGDPALVGGLLLENAEVLAKDVLTFHDEIPDALVDPNGNLVRDTRIIVQNQTKKRELEEQKLLKKQFSSNFGRSVDLGTWILAILSCACIVSCGVLPAVLLRWDGDIFSNSGGNKKSLKYLLSFATGSLLGDVFLHLLPEVWTSRNGCLPEFIHSSCNIEIWVLAGILSCFFIEKSFSTTLESQKRVCAIMNLCTNIADNFTHGLAVGASFLICPKLGCLTTFAIVIHELPHEISDFAILLRGNFSVWTAVEAQLLTAIGAIFGACFALYSHSVCVNDLATSRLLSFTAGSFINIGLCQIVPDLLQESNPKYYFVLS